MFVPSFGTGRARNSQEQRKSERSPSLADIDCVQLEIAAGEEFCHARPFSWSLAGLSFGRYIQTLSPHPCREGIRLMVPSSRIDHLPPLLCHKIHERKACRLHDYETCVGNC